MNARGTHANTNGRLVISVQTIYTNECCPCEDCVGFRPGGRDARLKGASHRGREVVLLQFVSSEKGRVASCLHTKEPP